MSLRRSIRSSKPIILSSLKVRLRNEIEYFSDVGAKEHYGQFGRDEVLQGYFEVKTWKKNREGFVAFSRSKLGTGLYVDVGAHAPKQHSNPYWFYKQVWQGINVDATPGSMRTSDLVRKRNTDVEAAVSDREAKVVFYYWGIPAVMNTLSPELADDWTRELG